MRCAYAPMYLRGNCLMRNNENSRPRARRPTVRKGPGKGVAPTPSSPSHRRRRRRRHPPSAPPPTAHTAARARRQSNSYGRRHPPPPPVPPGPPPGALAHADATPVPRPPIRRGSDQWGARAVVRFAQKLAAAQGARVRRR